MKLLFIQSLGVNHQLERLIGIEFPGKFEEITFTDSFDHALSLLQEKNKVLVFSSWTFTMMIQSTMEKYRRQFLTIKKMVMSWPG